MRVKRVKGSGEKVENATVKEGGIKLEKEKVEIVKQTKAQSGNIR